MFPWAAGYELLDEFGFVLLRSGSERELLSLQRPDPVKQTIGLSFA